MPENELFYAGYWLAKSGKYEEALAYLALANASDERVQTYIGYATRKLGKVDAALPHYAKALEINPNYTVARAYLGEAYLSRGDAARAKVELQEIASRCGDRLRRVPRSRYSDPRLRSVRPQGLIARSENMPFIRRGRGCS